MRWWRRPPRTAGGRPCWKALWRSSPTTARWQQRGRENGRRRRCVSAGPRLGVGHFGALVLPRRLDAVGASAGAWRTSTWRAGCGWHPVSPMPFLQPTKRGAGGLLWQSQPTRTWTPNATAYRMVSATPGIHWAQDAAGPVLPHGGGQAWEGGGQCFLPLLCARAGRLGGVLRDRAPACAARIDSWAWRPRPHAAPGARGRQLHGEPHDALPNGTGFVAVCLTRCLMK